METDTSLHRARGRVIWYLTQLDLVIHFHLKKSFLYEIVRGGGIQNES